MNERFFTVWFIFCAVAAVTWLGFVMWAISRVVLWLTT